MNITRSIFMLSILIVGLLGVAAPQAALAKDAGTNPGVVEYARTYGVTIEEARWRLSKEDYASEVTGRIEAESPTTFAGSWIEHKPVFRVVVRFVGDAKAQLAKYTQDPLFVPQTAPRSYEVLVAAQADIADRLAKDGIDFESNIDLMNSEITLYVRDPAMVLRKFAVVFRASPFIRLYKSNSFVEPTAISGGQELDLTINNHLVKKCTAGFNVFDGNRELGIITAGHCEDNLTYKPTRTKLDYQINSSGGNIGNYDVQWSKQHIRESVTPEQQTNSIDLINGPAPSKEIKSVRPSSSYLVVKSVCKSGIITGYNCGEVVNKNHLENWGGQAGSYVEVHNASNEEMTIFGDSGGPVFGSLDDNAAYGIIHGRPGADKPDHNDLLFMPIERLSVLGVSVLTEPFEITSIPDVSGPNGVIPITVNFKGVPRFPVTVTIEPVTCPPPWECFPASGQYTTNQPSPLMVGWSCDNDGTVPTTQFTVRTTLQDASLILPPSVEHHVTCIAPLASKSRTRRPTGRAGGVILDQPRPRH
jgi:hypothetical protein